MTVDLITLTFENRNIRTALIDAEPAWCGKDVCDSLGYANASKAMADHCRGVTNRYPIVDALGRTQNARFLHLPDVIRLIVGCTLPIGEKMERWIFEEAVPTILKTGSYGVNAQLEDRLQIAELKIQVFEEHSPAKFYDMDEVAALMHHYIKPPFGRNHLKRWLIERKILCTQAFKNDKPIQVYIDRGWFVCGGPLKLDRAISYTTEIRTA